MPKYVCSNDPTHQYDAMTVDGFCPIPDCYGVGFLVEQGGSSNGSPSSASGSTRDIGLCVLLMDVSYSMTEPAFASNPATKEQLVVGSAAGGIFELEQLSNKGDAYVAVVTFDSSVRPVFTQSIQDILSSYQSSSKFSQFLLQQFSHGGTDINAALSFAKQIYDDFTVRGDLTAYGGPSNVRPIKHSILTKTQVVKIVPNIRVLIYTDGEDQATGHITGNPFKSEDVDVLMAAFFGEGHQEGCSALKGIVSKCPDHDIDQFFLINDASRIQTLRRLFRMASGASGFCPACLAQDR